MRRGTGAERPALARGRNAFRAALAVLPWLAAVAAVLLLAASGLARRDLAGTALDDWFYGFFVDRYALFLFAIVYGVARILAAAAGNSAAGRLRLLSLPAALVLFLGLCLFPTFGGLVLRAGFATGGVMFMSQQPLGLAYAGGTAAAAALYGLALGGSEALAAWRAPVTPGALARAGLALLALWWAAALLALPDAAAVGTLAAWPGRLPGPATGPLAALLVGAALLPHALLSLARPRAG